MIEPQKSISRALLRAGVAPVVLGAMLAAAPAFAQTQNPADPQPVGVTTASPDQNAATDEGEAIVITGSRIQRKDLTSAAPLSVVTQEEFKLRGAVNVEQVLNDLPQVVPGFTAFSNNPGDGSSTLNLRNLGATRTLVLVNGRRYMFFDTQQLVDLNTIPTFLIDGVDVVTGGASAVYGSDAIAGVVNFRLRQNLQGVEIGTQYGITSRGDGRRWDTHIAIGGEFADGKGHATVYGEHYKRNPIFQDARGFSTFSLADDGEGGFSPGGSGTGPAGRFASISPGAAGTPFGSALGATFDTPGGPSRPFTGGDLYNYAPQNYLQTPQERWLVGGYADYQLSDALDAYTEISFANNRVNQALAPTPVTGTFQFNVANESQYLSPADAATLAAIADENGIATLSIGRRTSEVGLRQSENDRNAFRALAGVKGDITEKLHYDAYYSYARTRNGQIQEGNVSRSALQAGLLDGSVNIFGPGSLTPAMVQQISILAQNQDISTLQVLSASVNGELFNLGMGGDDIGFAAGVERRAVSSRFVPDTALSSGDVIGFNAGAPTQGRYHVLEGYGEVNVPIIADRPFFKKLEVHGAGRYSSYSLEGVGNVWTYEGDAKWSPIQDITFRGQYQHAVRAPNVGELFGGNAQGFPAAKDPCANEDNAGRADIAAVCLATGVPNAGLLFKGVPSTVQLNEQIEGAFGGNPNLSAEKSNSFTFGAVITPRFVPRLHIQADYFNIKVKDVIASAGGGVANILDLCYNQIQDPNSIFCQLIKRNPTTGSIDGSVNSDGTVNVVSVGNANLASLKTSGVDVQVDYSQPLNFGMFGETSKLNFFFLGTWTQKNDTFLGIGDIIKCSGRFGNVCGEPQSKYKWTSRLSYIDGGMTASVAWRHLSKAKDDDDTIEHTTEVLKAYNTFDLALSYDINDNYSLSLGANNFLDKKPQLVGDQQEAANTYPSVYDVLGRDFFVSANIKF